MGHFTRLLLSAGLALSACSPGFDARWRDARQTTFHSPYTGCWAGTWQSSTGAHHGQLECVLTPGQFKPSGTNVPYPADFHAHWGPFASAYEVELSGLPTRAGLAVAGQQDLGTLQGGLYRYQGVVTAQHFQMKYESKYDTGTFTLRRSLRRTPHEAPTSLN